MLFSSCEYRKGEIKGNKPNMKDSMEGLRDDNGDVMLLWIAKDSLILNRERENELKREDIKILIGMSYFSQEGKRHPPKST